MKDIPEGFGDDRAEIEAAFAASILSDRSACARIVGTGPDLLGLLDRLSTGEVKQLAAGEGRPTVLTSAKGRIVERLFVHHLGPAGVLLVGGAGRARAVLDHLKRYTFAERTGLSDASSSTVQLALSGPRAVDVLHRVSLAVPLAGASCTGRLGDSEVHVLGEDGFATDGFSIVADVARFADVWKLLDEAVRAVGGRPAGERALEAWRILRGLPAPGHELSEDYNPLEAGLADAISFSKGCYVGQEVVARLRTYDKVSRMRIGIALPAGHPVPVPGTSLLRDGRPAGIVTSATLVPGETAPIGLAYLKKREAEGSDDLHLEGSNAAVRRIELPFPRPRQRT
jgi:folate-binding protein YgfZ